MDINATTKFSQIYDEMRSKPLNRNVEIRGTHDGTQLYVHTAGKPSGSGALKAQARAQKFQDGAETIRKAIDKEYGPGWGNRVFQHIRNNNQNVDLSARIKRSDLTTIRDTIASLQASDAHTLKTGTIDQQLALLGTMPLDRTSAPKLMEIAQNPLATPTQRDLAANLLQGKMMALSAAEREFVLCDDKKFPNEALLDAMFSLRLSTGARAFSVADLSTIAYDQFKAETPNQPKTDFFRGRTLCSGLLNRGLAQLDNGRIPQLASDIRGMITAGVGLANLQHLPMTVTSPTGADVANPAVVNPILDEVEDLLGQQQQTPELHMFLQRVSDGIDAGPPPTGWTGDRLIKNAVILRGVCPDVTSNAPEGSQRNVAIAVSAALQQAINLNAPFAPTGRYAGLNPSVTTFLNPGSGYNNFMGDFP